MASTVEQDRPRAREAVVRCDDCGLTLHAGAVLHDRALVLAGVCPRCDGTLRDVPARPDPSIYLS